MPRTIENYLQSLELGQETLFQNMAAWPVFIETAPGPRFLSLDEALSYRVIEITEVSEYGDVPNLFVRNMGEIPVLILAGEELVGAKQNRIVNATFLVAANSKLTVPVSCVEQGRWSYQGKAFKSEHRMTSSQLRSSVEESVSRNLRQEQGFRADQSQVWNNIEKMSNRLDVKSKTAAMSALFDSYDDRLGLYKDHFPRTSDQEGFLVAINGRAAGLEIFDSANNLAKYYDKLIRSYALDAIDLQRGRPQESSRADKGKVEGWMAEVKKAPLAKNPSLGLGEDLRLEGEKVIGSGLLHQETVLYLSVFPKARGLEMGESGSRMARYTQRGGFFRE